MSTPVSSLASFIVIPLGIGLIKAKTSDNGFDFPFLKVTVQSVPSVFLPLFKVTEWPATVYFSSASANLISPPF
jgi:predicted Na+-dependent transporter